LAEKLNDDVWIDGFLSAIFDPLNELNVEIQGKNRTTIDIG
jgi:hypothetical protein